MKIYAVRNRLSERNETDGLFTFPTDTIASVTLAEAIIKGGKSRIEECELLLIGELNETTDEITPHKPAVISWDTRRLKEPMSEEKTKEEVKKDLEKI